MEIKKIKTYGYSKNGVELFVHEDKYVDKLCIPTVGDLFRFDSGDWFGGLFEVTSVVYLKSSKVVKIKCQKYKEK